MEGTDNPTGDIETYMRSALSRSLLEMSVQLGAENDEEVTIEFGALPEVDEFDDDDDDDEAEDFDFDKFDEAERRTRR